MKPALTKDNTTLYHYRNGVRREGKNFFMRGDCSRLRGDCTMLHGNCTGLYGDCTDLIGSCSKLKGDCSRIYGYCSDLSGDCMIYRRLSVLESRHLVFACFLLTFSPPIVFAFVSCIHSSLRMPRIVTGKQIGRAHV